MNIEYLLLIKEYLSTYGIFLFPLCSIALLICGLGIPIPRNFILVAAGILCVPADLNVHLMFILCLSTITGTDLLLFWLGWSRNPLIVGKKSLLAKKISPRKMVKVRRLFKKFGSGIILITSFLPGLRTAIYIMSGMNRNISVWRFLALDSMSTFVMVPLWVYTGYLFADNFEELQQQLSTNGRFSLFFTIFIILSVIAFWIFKYLKNKFYSKLEQ